MDPISDSGDPWPGIEAPVDLMGRQALEVQPGDRFTWDGQSLENRVPVALQVQLQQLAAKINAMRVIQGPGLLCEVYLSLRYVAIER
jgi:hypothetical protein